MHSLLASFWIVLVPLSLITLRPLKPIILYGPISKRELWPIITQIRAGGKGGKRRRWRRRRRRRRIMLVPVDRASGFIHILSVVADASFSTSPRSATNCDEGFCYKISANDIRTYVGRSNRVYCPAYKIPSLNARMCKTEREKERVRERGPLEKRTMTMYKFYRPGLSSSTLVVQENVVSSLAHTIYKRGNHWALICTASVYQTLYVTL